MDARADIYALGCVAYFLLTGTVVFPDENPMSMALKQVQETPDPPSSADRGADSLRISNRSCCGASRKSPAERPASAREVADLLAACAAAALDSRGRRRLVGATPAADVHPAHLGPAADRTRPRSSRKSDVIHV